MQDVGRPEMLIIFLIFVVVAIVLMLIPYWKIFGKAGFSPALSLLMLVPVVNIAMLYYLAFAEWPSLRQIPK
jgi:ABC-type maltose transport system permease subunit